MRINKNMNLILQAVQIGQPSIVRRLISEGHNVNESTESGNCPLLEAAKRNDIKIVQILLENGARPHVKDSNGISPLNWAIKHGNTNMQNMIGNLLNQHESQKSPQNMNR